MGTLATSDLGPLYIIADTLQCTSLKNHVVAVIGERACVRELSSDSLSLVKAVGSTRNMELFKALLPTFSLEGLRMSTAHLFDDCGKDFAIAAMEEMAIRASPATSCLWIFVVDNCGSFKKGVGMSSEPVVVKRYDFALGVYPAGDDKSKQGYMSAWVSAKNIQDDVKLGPLIFEVGIVSWKSGKIIYSECTTQTFTASHALWGWSDFYQVSKLTVANGGLRETDEAVKFIIRIGGRLSVAGPSPVGVVVL